MPVEIPEDGETVWVRRWWFGPPWQAEWRAATQTFVELGGLVIPWYDISRWKHVVEP